MNKIINQQKTPAMKTIKNTLILAVLMMAGIVSNAQKQWVVDNVHSGVKFTVSHLVISEVEGNFKNFTGQMTATQPDFSDAKINFTVDVNSINTDNEMRDKHLKSDDFFNAEKFPSMSFKSLLFKKTGEKRYDLVGELTIRDVTKKVKFNVTYGGTVKDPYGNTKAGFKATATINRLDFGLKWNNLTEAGGAVVGSDVNILLNLEFTQSK